MGINANLTDGLPLIEAQPLPENAGICFMGDTKVGPFDIDASLARQMLATPNPDGRSNEDVVRPWKNGDDISGRPRDMWIVDFPPGTTLEEAELYEAPFEHISQHVRPKRASNRRDTYRDRWWVHGEARPGDETSPLALTAVMSLHLEWQSTDSSHGWIARCYPTTRCLPSRATTTTFSACCTHGRTNCGRSRKGRSFARRRVAFATRRPPASRPSPSRGHPATNPPTAPSWKAIAEAARRLNELREGWLNPEGPLVGEDELKRRTLTNLYNERPAWLDTAHRRLDEAVFNAYGWPPNLSDDEVLARLLALNQERAAAQG